MSGKLIVVEGLDRAGKTSQCQLLASKLRSELNQPVVEMKFPNRSTPTGQIINKYLTDKSVQLSDQAIHLLFSANRWESVPEINKLLNAGQTVLVDRYSYSGVAFSAAKGLDYEWCRSPDIGLPEPDMVLFLDIDAEEASKRGGYGEERYELNDLQQKVRAQFKKLSTNEWKLINANKSFDDVSDQIWTHVCSLYNNK